MSSPSFLALDLGAGSGRAIVGSLTEGKFALQEVHRFPNTMVRLPDGLHWNTLSLFENCLAGIRAARAETVNLVSLGIDTWGVDYALLGEGDRLLGVPYAYRDSRTEGLWESWSSGQKEQIYQETGIQFMPFNTLVQLKAESSARPNLWDEAESFLSTPDLLNFWLTGVKKAEFSMATTSQMVDPSTRNWSKPVLEFLGAKPDLFAEIAMPGTSLGRARLQQGGHLEETDIQVILPGCHDTASAEAAVPALGDDHVWISTGTWSIMGMTLASPIRTPEAMAANMTNEGAVDGRIRFCRNITGLWLVQECMREWGISVTEAAELAENCPSPGSWVNSTDTCFLMPDSMPQTIQSWCQASGQKVPSTKAEILRCAYESIAMGHARCLNDIRHLTERSPKTIHLVGGGSQSRLLCQLTADMTGLPVVAGPVEATSLGNIAIQMVSLGLIGSLSEAKEIIAHSGLTQEFKPEPERDWADLINKLPKTR
jgi:rhamnulokinase